MKDEKDTNKKAPISKAHNNDTTKEEGLSNKSEETKEEIMPTEPVKTEEEPPTEENKPKRRKPMLCAKVLAKILDKNKMSVYYEPVKKKVVWLWNIVGADRRLIDSKLIDHIQLKCNGYNESKFHNCVKILSIENEQNIILERIKTTIWDERDHLAELYEILGIDLFDRLSRILIFKWLWQGLVLLENDEDDPVGADGVLVLTGKAGIGKTSVFRQLSIDKQYFGEGCSYNNKDKDSIIDTLGNFISELGEIETTFRSDIEALKNFVTRAVDRIRHPYGRKASETARRTNLCGTCNSEGFLIDPNGNRRFWTVPVEKIDLQRLRKFDAEQLWAQMYEIFKDADKAGFRLTPDEREELEERNRNHMKGIPAEEEVRDILAEVDAEPDAYEWKDMTVSQWKEQHPSIIRFGSEKIGRVLNKLGIEMKSTRINGARTRLRKLPHKIGC